MMQQPAVYGVPVGGARLPWTTGLCGCLQDISNCCVTCFCPCVTFGRNVEIIDKGITSCCYAGITCYCLSHIGFGPCYSCTYRTRLRAYFNLTEDPCNDCLVHCCCTPCALCQEYRELKLRGFDPSLGWMANAEKWSRVATAVTVLMPPTYQPGMSRTSTTLITIQQATA